MKILMLHISDTHIRDDNDVDINRIDKMINSLSVIKGFEECIIVFSGDLANSGVINEYKHVEHFLGNIIKRIKNKYLNNKPIYVLTVPGNHDIDFGNEEIERKDIIELHNRGEADLYIGKELKKLKAFFKFSNRNRCFLRDKVIDKRIINLNGYKIGATLINSTLYSTKKDDKGIHYIPEKYIDELKENNEVELMVTVIHHSQDWFIQKNKNQLEKLLYKNSSIIFLGHEHNPSNKNVTIDAKDNVIISEGGIFGNHKQKDISEYYAILVDTVDYSHSTVYFSWDAKEKFYKHKYINQSEPIKKCNNSNKMMPSREFLKDFLLDDKHAISQSCLDYFVFPRLIRHGEEEYTSDIGIIANEKFIDEVELNKRIMIVGNENSGKTTLLKNLYISLMQSKIPLFLTAEDIKNKKYERIIKFAFEEQYSDDPIEYIKFQQISSSSKVAIIDDIDLVKENSVEKFIDDLANDFNYIVISSKLKWNFDLIKKAKIILEREEKFHKYIIQGFYSDKRQELIRKICRINGVSDESIIEEYVKKINKFIKNQIKLFSLEPDFIIQYVKYFFSVRNTFNINDGIIFSKVFETNIVNSIRNCSDEDNIDVNMIVLDKIAYYIHFTKKYPLPYYELEKVVSDYNAKYDKEVKPADLLKTAYCAKILKETGDGELKLKFVNKNSLAFFISRELIRKYHEEDDMSGLNYVLSNICFGINSDILLFISYLTSNVRILRAIYEKADNYMSEWEEFSIDSGNIKFLNNLKSRITVERPTSLDKEKLDKIETKSEHDLKNSEVVETTDIYDYNEEDIALYINKLITTLKYTEIVAKILPNFEYMMPKEDKHDFVKGVYSFPNKIIYSWLKTIDDNFEELVNDIKANIDRSRDDIVKTIELISIGFALFIYDLYASLTADQKTKKILNTFNYADNTNYIIQNIMMHENLSNIDEFVNKADNLFDKNKKHIVRLMVTKIVKKCLIYHEGIKLNKKQHLLNKYFEDGERRAFLLQNALNKNKKL